MTHTHTNKTHIAKAVREPQENHQVYQVRIGAWTKCSKSGPDMGKCHPGACRKVLPPTTTTFHIWILI